MIDKGYHVIKKTSQFWLNDRDMTLWKHDATVSCCDCSCGRWKDLVGTSPVHMTLVTRAGDSHNPWVRTIMRHCVAVIEYPWQWQRCITIRTHNVYWCPRKTSGTVFKSCYADWEQVEVGLNEVYNSKAAGACQLPILVVHEWLFWVFPMNTPSLPRQGIQRCKKKSLNML